MQEEVALEAAARRLGLRGPLLPAPAPLLHLTGGGGGGGGEEEVEGGEGDAGYGRCKSGVNQV